MPTKSNDLENYLFIPVPDWERFGRLLEVDRAVHACSDQYGISHMKTEELEEVCRAEFNIDQLLAEGHLTTARQFLKEQRPIAQEFTILARAADFDERVTVVRRFDESEELASINAAANGEKPYYFNLMVENRGFLGPDDGWLLGSTLWGFSDRELERHGVDELELLLLDAAGKDRRRFDRLKRQSGAGFDDKARRVPIPEEARIFVWRRDQGRCVQCGSNENLEYDHVIPVSKGGSSTERNLQLLCELCNRQKSDHI